MHEAPSENIIGQVPLYIRNTKGEISHFECCYKLEIIEDKFPLWNVAVVCQKCDRYPTSNMIVL